MKRTATMAALALPPVIKSVLVEASPERAFHGFTAEIATWWPLESHSIGQQDALSVELEPRVGGQIVESIRGKDDCVWGTVTAWDPPRRVGYNLGWPWVLGIYAGKKGPFMRTMSAITAAALWWQRRKGRKEAGAAGAATP